MNESDEVKVDEKPTLEATHADSQLRQYATVVARDNSDRSRKQVGDFYLFRKNKGETCCRYRWVGNLKSNQTKKIIVRPERLAEIIAERMGNRETRRLFTGPWRDRKRPFRKRKEEGKIP